MKRKTLFEFMDEINADFTVINDISETETYVLVKIDKKLYENQVLQWEDD